MLELPSGAVADLVGRRTSMVASFVAYIASFLTFALASHVAWLVMYPEAEPLLVQGCKTLHAEHGDEHEEVRQARAALAACYTGWGKPDEAAAYR